MILQGRFRKKPVVIRAIMWTGDNLDMVAQYHPKGKFTKKGSNLLIKTLEGEMQASPEDWIIEGVKGEVYSCRGDIFTKTYEPLN